MKQKQPADADQPHNVCRRCGKNIAFENTKGSLTAYLFQGSLCACGPDDSSQALSDRGADRDAAANDSDQSHGGNEGDQPDYRHKANYGRSTPDTDPDYRLKIILASPALLVCIVLPLMLAGVFGVYALFTPRETEVEMQKAINAKMQAEAKEALTSPPEPSAEPVSLPATKSLSPNSFERNLAIGEEAEKALHFDGKPFLQGLIDVRGGRYRRYFFPVLPQPLNQAFVNNMGTLELRLKGSDGLRILKGPILVPEKARTLYRPSPFAMSHPAFLSGFSNGDVNALALDLPDSLENTPLDGFPQSFCTMPSIKVMAVDSLPAGSPNAVENLAVDFLNRFDHIDHLKVKIALSKDAFSRIKWLGGIHRFSVFSVAEISSYLKVLEGVRQLNYLRIEGADLKDDDIKAIAKLKHLKTIQIVFKDDSKPDTRKLHLLEKALPVCRINPWTTVDDDF